MGILPERRVDPAPCSPFFWREGDAQVNFEPCHPVAEAELEFHVAGWPKPVSCSERQWRELVAAVSMVLADPLAETRRAVRNSVALGDRRAAA
jgi:hypothetical protein